MYISFPNAFGTKKKHFFYQWTVEIRESRNRKLESDAQLYQCIYPVYKRCVTEFKLSLSKKLELSKGNSKSCKIVNIPRYYLFGAYQRLK